MFCSENNDDDQRNKRSPEHQRLSPTSSAITRRVSEAVWFGVCRRCVDDRFSWSLTYSYESNMIITCSGEAAELVFTERTAGWWCFKMLAKDLAQEAGGLFLNNYSGKSSEVLATKYKVKVLLMQNEMVGVTVGVGVSRVDRLNETLSEVCDCCW